MSFSIDKYFKVLNFLQDNPIIMTQCQICGTVHRGKLTRCPLDYGDVDYISLQEYISNETLLKTDRLDLMMDLLEWDPTRSVTLPRDMALANTALSARDKVRNYFGNALAPGSYAYNTDDMNLFKRMVVDWSSTARTFKDLMMHATDAFTLDDDDIDKAIRGFGIDFVNKKTLPTLITRQFFLLAICELYKIKGSPASIVNALYYAGMNKSIIREYWVERTPNTYKDLQIRGIASGKGQQIYEDRAYSWSQDQSLFDDTIHPWSNFEKRLVDVGDPHWWYTSDEIINIERDTDTHMKLPSITPYFGIEYMPDVEKINLVMGIVEHILSSQFNAYLKGDKNIVTKSIGIVDSDDATEREVWIDGYDSAVTMLECYLAWVYCQIRYDEYLQYKHLVDYLEDLDISVPVNTYKYPWAYQELIYSLHKRIESNELVDGVIELAAIVKAYPSNSTPYYCSTNELISWWLQREMDSDDDYDPTTATVDNLPSIFTDKDYPFLFQLEEEDTNLDKILYYNGPRRVELSENIIEYDKIVTDNNRMGNLKTCRRRVDTKDTSYHTRGSGIILPTTKDAQYEYMNEYYDYISWSSEDYVDHESHDGSTLTPYYVSKYPKPTQWNWGVDSGWFYYSPIITQWVRIPIETSWDIGYVEWDASDGYVIGDKVYDGGYMYMYVSTDQWIRYECDTEWDYTDSPITTDSTLRVKTDFARTHIKARVSTTIADIYLNNTSDSTSLMLSITLNPLSAAPETYRYTLSELESYLDQNRLVMDENGYIFKDFSHIYENGYIYERVTSSDGDTIWVKTLSYDEWEDNGDKLYNGGFRYPNLDLTNRYDAERILRGNFVLEITDLYGVDVPDSKEMLVSNGEDGHPEVWSYDDELLSWSKDETNKIGRIPGQSDIQQINLGFGNELIEWIDNTVYGDDEEYVLNIESTYGDIGDKFLNAFSNYVKVILDDSEIDIGGIYKNIKNEGLYKNLIDFFKPKRARILYFAINLVFDERIFNSIIVEDEPEYTKMIQQINDYVPRQDTPFIQTNGGLYKTSYHSDDRTQIFEIPSNDVYGDPILYLKGFDDDRVNGYYYNRSELGQDTNIYFLNEHNICLTLITNADSSFNGYEQQWVISFRRDSIEWCDAIYTCYDSDYLTGMWFVGSDNIYASTGTIIEISDLKVTDIRPCDYIYNIDQTGYTLDVEQPWNIDGLNFRRVANNFQHPAMCLDPLNIRNEYPTGAHGHPENLTGARFTGYDALTRSGDPSGNQEEAHSFDNWLYHDDDDRVTMSDAIPRNIRGHADNLIERDQIDGDKYWSRAAYNDFTEIKIPFAIADGIKKQFLLRVVELNENLNIYIDNNLLVKDVDWFVEYVTNVFTNDETYIQFAEVPTNDAKLYYSYYTPMWWFPTTECPTFNSGPIHHRPAYLGMNIGLDDTYPCIVSGCCDYFDTGCIFDGSSNPAISRWTPGHGWGPTKYSELSLDRRAYDIHTNHHMKYGHIIDEDLQEYWKSRDLQGGLLSDIGDTYCTECDVPLYTPDTAVFSLPSYITNCGVYHKQITATNFQNELSIYNGSYSSIINDIPYIIEDYDKDVYQYGYRKDNSADVQLAHRYDRDSGLHYWEIQHRTGGEWTIIASTTAKSKLHTSADIEPTMNESEWHFKTNQFLNGHDVDIVEDDWTTINGDVDGRFDTSIWIRFPIVAPYPEYIYGGDGCAYYGQVDFIPDTNIASSSSSSDIESISTGRLYICVKSGPTTNDPVVWKMVENVECDWDESEESIIRPTDDGNIYGYRYKNSFIYLYIESRTYVGWVRIPTTPSIPSSGRYDYYTGDWKLSTLQSYAYKLVTVAEDVEPEFADNVTICADLVPYNETYAVYETAHSECHVEESTNVSLIEYFKSTDGDYIKIKTTFPDDESRKEHRWIAHGNTSDSIPSKIADGLAAINRLNAYLQDPTSTSIDSDEYYEYKPYIPFHMSLNNGNPIQWEMDGDDLWDINNATVEKITIHTTAVDDDLRILIGDVIVSNPKQNGSGPKTVEITKSQIEAAGASCALDQTVYVEGMDGWSGAWRIGTWSAEIEWSDGSRTTKTGGTNMYGDSLEHENDGNDEYPIGTSGYWHEHEAWFEDYRPNGSFTLNKSDGENESNPLNSTQVFVSNPDTEYISNYYTYDEVLTDGRIWNDFELERSWFFGWECINDEWVFFTTTEAPIVADMNFACGAFDSDRNIELMHQQSLYELTYRGLI